MSNTTAMVEPLDFEWNVFESQHQFYNWQQESTSTTGPLSPESMLSPTVFSQDHSIHQDHESPRDSSSSSTDGDSQSISLKGQKSPDRRRSQNRKAQRAFRQRQKQHTESLEQRLQSILSDYEELQQNYTKLQIDYNEILRDKEAKVGRDVEMAAFTHGWRVGGLEEEKDGVFEIDEFLAPEEGLRWGGL